MQHDFNIANQGFPATRADLNNALAALASTSSGTSEPSTTYANQFWYDTTNNLLKFRNEADSAWITFAYLDQATNEWEIRSAVVQAVDSAGVTIKTDDGTARITVADSGNVTFANDVDVDGRATGAITTDNDLSFDMSATNNFKCTPTGTGTLTFTNITAGQSGNIWLDNSGGYAISAASTTYISSADLSAISAAGVYFLSYYSDGTNALVSVSRALTSAGA